jgi:hypothetical protein
MAEGETHDTVALTVFDVRRNNLRQLAAEWGGPTMLALKLGHASGSFMSQIAGPHPRRDISEKVARKIERTLKLQRGWLDVDRRRGAPAGNSTAPSPTAVDPDLLVSVTQAVLFEVQQADGKAMMAKVPELVSLAYKHASDAGAVDASFIRHLIRLLK